MKKEYSMIQVECGSGWGAISWIIYPKGGSYITDELCKLPGGNQVKDEAANKVFEAMNS